MYYCLGPQNTKVGRKDRANPTQCLLVPFDEKTEEGKRMSVKYGGVDVPLQSVRQTHFVQSLSAFANLTCVEARSTRKFRAYRDRAVLPENMFPNEVSLFFEGKKCSPIFRNIYLKILNIIAGIHFDITNILDY